MSAPSKVTCACGHHIQGRDLLRRGCFMSRWQPIWVYLKYRCSRCRMVGEKLIDYQDWDEHMLADEGVLSEAEGGGRSTVLGAIGDDELREFSTRIRDLRRSDLDALTRDPP